MEKKDLVRRVSRGGVFLGYWTTRQANIHIRSKRATVLSATRRRLRAVTDLEAGVDCAPPAPALKTVDVEQLADTMRVLTLRRVDGRGYHEWDPNLTFVELRNGRMVSAETIRKRREEAALRFIQNEALNRANRQEARG